MSDEVDGTPIVNSTQVEINQILGLFDAPAFARRALELEYAIHGLRQRLAREREAMLDMVRLRLRQWASVSSGPDDWVEVFSASIDSLWLSAGADDPCWGGRAVPPRRRRAAARDLVSSVLRFNRRWNDFLERLSLETVNRRIDDYNRYYVLEKECVLGSSRLAAQHFQHRPSLTSEDLMAEFPTLEVPEPLG
jgi:hypothetical protein